MSRSSAGLLRGRSSCALIHALAHAIRIPTAGESLTAWRSSTTSLESRSSPAVVGPSNMPRSGPSHRSCSASAARRASAANRSGVVRSRSAMSTVGVNSTAAISGSVGSSTPLATQAAQRLPKRPRLDLGQRRLERGLRHRSEQLELAVLVRARRQRVEPHPAAGDERDRRHPVRLAQRPVFALDVEHERAAPEQQHPPHQRLDRGRSCPARACRARSRSGRRALRLRTGARGRRRTRRRWRPVRRTSPSRSARRRRRTGRPPGRDASCCDGPAAPRSPAGASCARRARRRRRGRSRVPPVPAGAARSS